MKPNKTSNLPRVADNDNSNDNISRTSPMCSNTNAALRHPHLRGHRSVTPHRLGTCSVGRTLDGLNHALRARAAMAFQRCGGHPNALKTDRSTFRNAVLSSPNQVPPACVSDVKHKKPEAPHNITNRDKCPKMPSPSHIPRNARSPNCREFTGCAEAPCHPMRQPLATCIKPHWFDLACACQSKNVPLA